MLKYGLVHIALIYLAWSMFGFLYGILALVAFVYAADFVLNKLGYVRLGYMDLGCAYEIKCFNNHIGGWMEIDKIQYEEFKDAFVERALTRIRKLRQILVRKVGFFLWKDIDICDAMEQIMRDNTVLTCQDDIVEYVNKLNDTKLDRSKPVWEFRVIENYTEKTSLIVYRIHHTVLDGVGLGCLMSCINDKQFTSRLNKAVFKPTTAQKLSIGLNTLPTLAKVVPEMKTWCTDKPSLKLTEINGPDHYTNKYFATKEYDFKDIMKAYKKFDGMTFNDFMCAIIGKSFNQWFKDYKIEDAKKIGFIIPVNLRDLPTSYEDLHIDNFIASCKFELPIKDDIGSIMSTIKPVILKMTDPYVLYASLNLLKCIPYFPDVMNLQMFDDFTQGCDVSFSNIAFSDREWTINGKKVQNIAFFNNICLGISMAFMAYSYNGKVRFSLQTKKYQRMDASKIMEYICTNLEEEIKKASKA